MSERLRIRDQSHHPEEVAEAVMNSSDEWWAAFCGHVRAKSNARHQALVQAFTPGSPPTPEITHEALVEELDKIDQVLETFGFDSTRPVQEMTGAFERLRHLEIERGPLYAEAARVPELLAKIQRLRVEIRRFNRDAQARAEGFRAAFKDGAITAVRTLIDYLGRQSPPWATDRATEEFKAFLEAWIRDSEMINRKP